VSNRWFVIPAIGVMAVIIAFILFSGLADNTVYYLFVDEALERRSEFPDGERFRLAGIVVPDSIDDSGSELVFTVTNGEDEITVVTSSTPPQLFQEDISVLSEGYWQDDRFRAEQLIIQHSEEYRAPEGYEEAEA
jgi:cytochrome c-type biogenesis protein CcmE